jgi:hypothetical protein
MRYSVYVIRLRVEVLSERRVAKVNPDHVPYKPCVYVGSTAHSPEIRCIKHLTTKIGSKIVKKYHIKLHKKLTAKQPTFATRLEAETHEYALSLRLRKRGYATWSG